LRLTQAERISLLRADTVDATLQKIQHAAATLGPEKTETLLQDIIGWAQLKKGPLASLIGDSKADQHVMLWRAAGANLVSTEIDLNIMTDPLPDFAHASQMDGPECSDDSGNRKFTVPELMAWLDGKPAKADEMARFPGFAGDIIDTHDDFASGILIEGAVVINRAGQHHPVVRTMINIVQMRICLIADHLQYISQQIHEQNPSW